MGEKRKKKKKKTLVDSEHLIVMNYYPRDRIE